MGSNEIVTPEKSGKILKLLIKTLFVMCALLILFFGIKSKEKYIIPQIIEAEGLIYTEESNGVITPYISNFNYENNDIRGLRIPVDKGLYDYCFDHEGEFVQCKVRIWRLPFFGRGVEYHRVIDVEELENQ